MLYASVLASLDMTEGEGECRHFSSLIFFLKINYVCLCARGDNHRRNSVESLKNHFLLRSPKKAP